MRLLWDNVLMRLALSATIVKLKKLDESGRVNGGGSRLIDAEIALPVRIDPYCLGFAEVEGCLRSHRHQAHLPPPLSSTLDSILSQRTLAICKLRARGSVCFFDAKGQVFVANHRAW